MRYVGAAHRELVLGGGCSVLRELRKYNPGIEITKKKTKVSQLSNKFYTPSRIREFREWELPHKSPLAATASSALE